MSKAPADPRDNYGPPKKITDTTLALSSSRSSEKTLTLGSPSYLNKIMASPQPITRISPGFRPALVTPLQFTARPPSPSSTNTRPAKLAYYSPPETTPKASFITKSQIIPIIPLENHYCPTNSSLAQIVSKETTTCPQHKALLGFCAVFGITWITSWTLSTEPLWEDAPPLRLVKRYSVKWWSKFNPQLLSTERLNAWFKANPNLCKATKLSPSSEINDFSTLHPKLLESLKKITDPQEFFDKVKDAMSVLSDTESTSITSAAENEDDCYGIQDL
ncbi:unnamed protein product [Trifolium pratense]|uniref:Uncharacterized protein n=1 Tax=Trifolium pratense TaxID=57577 RepID=A0ACB0JPG2_TRIPR|nr:unnamed protein product [Trifolium pratense]